MVFMAFKEISKLNILAIFSDVSGIKGERRIAIAFIESANS